LISFLKLINNKKDASQHITKSAFFQTMKRVSHIAFIDLNTQLIDEICSFKIIMTKNQSLWFG